MYRHTSCHVLKLIMSTWHYAGQIWLIMKMVVVFQFLSERNVPVDMTSERND